MFANNPMGFVVKGMMEELRVEGEIPSSGWQDWIREHAAKLAHKLENGREKKNEEAQLRDLQPCENCG